MFGDIDIKYNKKYLSLNCVKQFTNAKTVYEASALSVNRRPRIAPKWNVPGTLRLMWDFTV